MIVRLVSSYTQADIHTTVTERAHMDILANENVIAFLLALIVGLIAYAFLVPRNLDSFRPEVESSNKILSLMGHLGTEVYASLPAGTTFHRKPNARIEDLLVKSGNPWKLTAQEFVFMQVVGGFVGFLVGWVTWFAISPVVSIPWFVLVPGAMLAGYFMPRSRYNDQAKRRDLEFKRQLPEALDLVIISLTGGATFVDSLRESIPNMQDGVLKVEFKDIVASVDTGRTLDESLLRFSQRAPNESIRTFVHAIREANELDTPLVEVLQSRAEASRSEFFALVNARTAALSSKIMGVLTPTILPAMLIIAIAPSISSIVASFG